MAYEAETWLVFPTAYEAEIGILDRSSTHGLENTVRVRRVDKRGGGGLEYAIAPI